MKHLLLILLVCCSFWTFGQEQQPKTLKPLLMEADSLMAYYEKNKEDSIKFNQALADELFKMVEVDQLAAIHASPPKEYKYFTKVEWEHFKDSVYRTHQKRLDQIFKENGYPGYDLVGKEGEKNFWLMVQHSDFDPQFQQQVLNKLEVEVKKGNADSKNYALLVDRVRVNTGNKQIYGTQVTYDTENCQAIPMPLEDSASVNERRKKVGLEPIEEYLNNMSNIHFEMNKDIYLKKGITQPKLYKAESVGVK